MKSYVIVGVLLFIAFAIAFAPAGILDRAVDRVAGVDLIDARGTLWQGKAQLLVEGTNQGEIQWQFRFLPLLKLTPTYAWSLLNPNGQLQGTVGYRGGGADLALEGSLLADVFNPWLRAYDLVLSGTFDIEPTAVAIDNLQAPRIASADGQIAWSGGPVRYVMSGLLKESTLPPLVAYLENEDQVPKATVFAQGEQTPLLFAEQLPNGFVKIGITKALTKVLKNPWPGSDPDHAVVLEVEEQVFLNQ